MKHIIYFFLNLKYRTKLILLCLLANLLPMSIMGSFCFKQTLTLLQNQELNSVKYAVNNSAMSLNTQVETYNNLLTYLSGASQITDLPSDFTTTYDLFAYLTYTLDPLISSIYSIHPEIDCITIYNSRGNLTHGRQLRPVSDLENESWYNEDAVTAKPQWYLNSNGQLVLIQKVMDPYIKYATSYSQNYIAVYLKQCILFSPLESMYDDYSVEVCSDTQHLFSYSADSMTDLQGNTKMTSVSASVNSCGWQITLFLPDSMLFYSVKHMANIIVIIILLCLFLIIFTGQIYTKFFMKRLDSLHYYMHQIKNGRFDFQIHDNLHDEIADLTNDLQAMVDEINRLIQENYKDKLTIKESQLKALQAQINPHFLYNCLSLINNKALMNHQNEISQMSQLLSTFYRTTLNKGRSETTLNDEIRNVTSYIHIQQLLHDNCFDVIYQIDQMLPDISIPNLLLQPLVENSIVHGILPNKGKRGQLFITVARIPAYVQITIMDNGLGIPPEKLKDLLRTDSSGYGLKNVHDRLQLSFGERSGLVVNSIPQQSTMITFRIPYDNA